MSDALKKMAVGTATGAATAGAPGAIVGFLGGLLQQLLGGGAPEMPPMPPEPKKKPQFLGAAQGPAPVMQQPGAGVDSSPIRLNALRQLSSRR